MIVTFDNLPKHCEFCNSELVWDSVNLVCSNPNCPNKNIERVKAWCLNIAPVDGLGWKTISKFTEAQGIYNVQDLYECAKDSSHRFHDVKEGSEKDLYNKMLDSLVKQPITVSQFLLGLKIPGLGKIGAKNVENDPRVRTAFDSILNFQGGDTCGNQNIWAILLQDVNVANSLYNEYREYFINCYNIVKDQIIFISGTVAGASKNDNVQKGCVVITGTLSVKRDDYIRMLESKGWKVSNKINKDVSYLITNTPDSGTSKNKEADRLGITKITEYDFNSKVLEVS